MSQVKKLLGKRIKELRNKINMSQEKMTELTGIGTPSISKIECGIYHPTDENLEKIAKALGVKPYELYMFEHLQEPNDLKGEIIAMLNKASEDEIRLIYKILNSIL